MHRFSSVACGCQLRQKNFLTLLVWTKIFISFVPFLPLNDVSRARYLIPRFFSCNYTVTWLPQAFSCVKFRAVKTKDSSFKNFLLFYFPFFEVKENKKDCKRLLRGAKSRDEFINHYSFSLTKNAHDTKN